MKFCFLGDISGALKGQTPGGGELQVALLAKALAIKGHEVVIVDPLASAGFVTSEGVRLVNVPGWNKGMRGVRLFTNRIPALRKILLEQNADYYYVRMRVYLHIVPYLVAKKTKGKFIVGLAHDLDVLSFWSKFKYEYRTKFNLLRFLTLCLPNDFIFNYVLKRSDFVTLQHEGQRFHSRTFKGKMGIFNNIFDYNNVPVIERPSRDYFVHAGSLTVLKGSENLYQLIKMIDKRTKIVIVGQAKDRKSKEIVEKLKKIDNVVVRGALNHKETIGLIANATALISTSNYEGFPNIFLEAWATGVPVISLKVNPGNIINKHGLGIFCDGDLERMKTCIERNETASIDGQKLKAYVSEFHNFEAAADRFLDIVHHE